MSMAQVRVRVVDAETRRPLPWALVQLDKLRAITDEEGLAEFKDVKPGTYVLKVRSGAHRPFTDKIRITDGKNELTIALTYALPGPPDAFTLRPGDVVGPEVYQELIKELERVRGGWNGLDVRS